MLFPEEHEIESVWNKVICLFAANRLGNTLLVSRDMKDENGSVVICVFTSDYGDIPDVFRVLIALWRNGVASNRRFLKYKTDGATIDGLYASDYAAQRAGFDGTKVETDISKRCSIYVSPKPYTDITGATERI